MTSTSDGILLIDKNEGESSHDVVRTVKKTLGLRKVGHAGTLDPFATGLLLILVDQGTKLSPFLMATKKMYQATVRLGVETDTLDRTGRVVAETDVPELSVEIIAKVFGEFSGEMEQTPPRFSALKRDGVRAYALARKGKEFELEKRRIFIHSLKLLDVKLPDVVVEVACSAGTYIRSLALDLGHALGTVGHLRSLRRLGSGEFHVTDAVNSKEIVHKGRALLDDHMISLKEAVAHMKEIRVAPNIAGKIRQGRQSVLADIADGMIPSVCDGELLKIITTDELVAVVKVNGIRRVGHVSLEIARVFI